MEVIEFPGANCLNKKTLKIRKEKIPISQQNNLIIGDATFTCPSCSNKTAMNFSGMIFRSIEFHCSKCGTKHKISNPAFSKSPPVTSENARRSK